MSIFLTPLGSDNFTRANENPLSQGGNWVADTFGDSELQIVSDLCEGTTVGVNAELYSGVSLPNDQYASVTVGSAPGFDASWNQGIRLTDNGGSFTTLPSYRLGVTPSGGAWGVYRGGNALLSGSGLTISVGDVFTIAVVGTTIYAFQNSTQLGSVTDTNYSSGESGLNVQPFSTITSMQFSDWVVGSASQTATYSISGDAGVAAARVSYSGTATGSVTADGSGNFSITGLANGTYQITPSLAGYVFSPTSRSEVLSGSNITGVNFTATAGSAYYSQPDCRVAVPGFGPGPNSAVNVNGTLTYTQQTSDNSAIPPTDSRKAGAPSEDGSYPQNNRNPARYT